MKRIMLLFLIFFISPIYALNLPVDITSKGAIVINKDRDIVMYTKNADDKMILASLTKIQQVAEEQGLSYNNNNIRSVKDDN